MKQFASIVLLLLVAVTLAVLFLYRAPAMRAESVTIAGERNKLAESEDKTRMESDLVYARSCELKLQNLDYLLAKAYNKENMPDAAINVLQKLIIAEEANNEAPARRRSRSCLNEARYYEALQQSYALKQDKTGAEQADLHRDYLIVIAQVAKKREQQEEGKSLRLVYGD